MRDGDDPAGRTARQRTVSLDNEHQRAIVAGRHVEDVHALDTNQFISVGTRQSRART